MPKTQRGQSLVEYVLVLSGLLLIIAAGFPPICQRLKSAWQATSHFFSLPSP